MRNKKSKKRTLRYLAIFEINTNFKEKSIDDLMLNNLPEAFGKFYFGKENDITVNKLK